MISKFDESKHPRKKDGKFAPKGKGENKHDRQKELENKFNSDLPNEQLPFSLGARWVNENIKMPDGSSAKFVSGSKIINKQVFVGKGTKTLIKDIERLTTKYPNTKSENWQKVKGHAEIDWKGEILKAEIHWYEEPSVGRVETKFKKEI